ncbi:LysR family transcriptional regulator [Senegalimassilia anaerobia]|uniref:LysR family transcriptional regulator n=1 Tax=Senegalimassilia anaerobia TaxID=1473216 RepID=UPI0023EFA41E|nr:LysR family transcriptional regulator [Senegalimassilia anaerobia]
MNIQQLRYFSKVYETNNFARAAEELYITRQALRKSILSLESDIGQQLFTNDSNILKPTIAAYDLYQASRGALRAFDELEQHMVESKERSEEIIRLGVSCGAEEVFPRKERLRFTEDYPGTFDVNSRLHTIESTPNAIYKMLLDGELDYGNTIDVSINDTLFDSQVACEGQIHLALRKDDPLADREEIYISDLVGRNFATQGPEYGIHRLIEEEAKRTGFELNIVMKGATQASMLRNVESGHSICYSYSQAKHPSIAPNVISIPFASPVMRWRYYSVCRKGMGDPYLLRYFAGKETAWGIDLLSS